VSVATERFARVGIERIEDLRAWLAEHHGRDESVWLVRYRKSVPEKFVDRLAVLDELICWGWVDGLARKLDDRRTMQLISPRRQQAWARSYKERAVRLAAEGRMMPPGLAAIDRSKALGLWDAYAAVDDLEVPEDLRLALEGAQGAAGHFLAAAPSYRRNVLRWIAAARRPETRVRRIAATAAASARGERLPQM